MSLPCDDTAERHAAERPELIRYTIDERLELAGQPQPEDWSRLAGEGFDVVINMRTDADRAAVQQRNAEAAGLRYVYLPLPAYELEAEHLARFHEALQNEDGRIFLHCRSATRVALMWMLDQMVYAGRTQDDVEADLRRIGYTDDAMETFSFCTEDYFERNATIA
jgi:uncharacterized protein (TIGR01244 family)